MADELQREVLTNAEPEKTKMSWGEFFTRSFAGLLGLGVGFLLELEIAGSLSNFLNLFNVPLGSLGALGAAGIVIGIFAAGYLFQAVASLLFKKSPSAPPIEVAESKKMPRLEIFWRSLGAVFGVGVGFLLGVAIAGNLDKFFALFNVPLVSLPALVAAVVVIGIFGTGYLFNLMFSIPYRVTDTPVNQAGVDQTGVEEAEFPHHSPPEFKNKGHMRKYLTEFLFEGEPRKIPKTPGTPENNHPTERKDDKGQQSSPLNLLLAKNPEGYDSDDEELGEPRDPSDELSGDGDPYFDDTDPKKDHPPVKPPTHPVEEWDGIEDAGPPASHQCRGKR